MRPYLWPEDGWPYPDSKRPEAADLDSNIDDDAMVLRGMGERLFEFLDPLERQVIRAHYGLDGTPPRTMKELHHDTGLPRAELREALAGGLAKLRITLAE
jgi:DNA-directed RNA polymerase sigma subunit (sigma70/sigma32)